jgi:hypothetical protein
MAVRKRRSSDQADVLPYEVRIDGTYRGGFAEVRDAMASARIAKQGHPSAHIAITDRKTGRLVIQID